MEPSDLVVAFKVPFADGVGKIDAPHHQLDRRVCPFKVAKPKGWIVALSDASVTLLSWVVQAGAHL